MTGQPIRYTSPQIAIGKHEWRLVATPSRFDPADYNINYEWRRQGEGQWQPQYDWPSYNHNDTYNGMPRTLSILYHRELPAVRAAFGKPSPPEPQLGMF